MNLRFTGQGRNRAVKGAALLCAFAFLTSGVKPVGLSEGWLAPAHRPPVPVDDRLFTLAGDSARLADFEERVLVVNFWATWCGPCRAEMPSLERLQSKLGRSGVRVIAITDEDRDTVLGFLQDTPYGFTFLLDPGRTLARRLRIGAVPWTLVLDSRRRLVHFHPGARLWDTPDILENLQELLKE